AVQAPLRGGEGALQGLQSGVAGLQEVQQLALFVDQLLAGGRVEAAGGRVEPGREADGEVLQLGVRAVREDVGGGAPGGGGHRGVLRQRLIDGDGVWRARSGPLLPGSSVRRCLDDRGPPLRAAGRAPAGTRGTPLRGPHPGAPDQ
ncbi:MAG: hypothetical protein ACK559_27010, partial [bacterium]